MPVTKDFGQFFTMGIHVDRAAPWFHLAPTYEIEPPFRICRHSVVFRLRPTGHAIVFGHWRPSGLTEEQALQQARVGRLVDLDTGTDPTADPATDRTIRDNITGSGLDEEWRLIDR